MFFTSFFMNPWLLAGAAFVAVPVVLHLIMRQKPKVLEFPALRFIQRRHDANKRRLRLRHLVLLLLRVLAILLVALALARPKVPESGSSWAGAWASEKAPVAAAMVFDTSKRMEYRHENRTRLEAAQELGTWVLGQLPPDSQVAVLDSRLGPGAFQVDLGAAQHRIERLETTANARPLTSVLDEALRVLSESKLERKEIYVFTDLARAAWPAEENARIRQRMAEVPDAGAYVIDVGVADPKDFSLGDLRLASQVLTGASPIEIDADVSARGEGGQRVVELYLFEPDPQKGLGARKAVKVGEQPVTIEPGRSQQVSLKKSSLSPGTHQGYVQILGQDGLAADDRRFFTVEVRPPWKVLIAAPKSADPTYLAEALSPTPLRRTGQVRYDVTVVPQEDLVKQKLDAFAAVCLLDPTPVDAATWQALGNYAAAGRGVAVFLGRNANRNVDSFNQPVAQQLLPGPLVRQVRSKEGLVHLAPRNYEHPILASLRSAAGTIPWDGFPVFRYWQLCNLAQGVATVVPFNDGGAALLERAVGKGRVVTMTTPVSDDPNSDPWNLIPSGDNAWPFVALVNETIVYLTGGGHQTFNYYAGQPVVLALDPQHTFRSYLLTGPDDVDVRMTPDLKEHTLRIDATDQAGNYRVRAGGSDAGVDRGFSVNLVPEQLVLDRISEEDLKKVLDPLPYRIARSRDQIEMNVSTGRVGMELFPILIVIVAAVLALEHVAANRFYRD